MPYFETGYGLIDIVFLYSFTFVLGACLGSFSSALIHRVPENLPWIWESSSKKNISSRSQCPHCKHELRARNLIPILSWIVQNGRCNYCSKRISSFYPLIECICAVLSVMIFHVFGISYLTLLLLMALPFLISLFIIDLRHFILPDQLVFIFLGLGILKAFTSGWPWGEELGSVVAHSGDLFLYILFSGLIFAGTAYFLGFLTTKILGRKSLGLGDVKFFAAAGVWLGWEMLPFFLIISGVFGVLVGGAYMKLIGNRMFPFGPALILAFFLIIFTRDFFQHMV